MVISNFSSAVISNVTNFHYLALFVCHLFGNGSFRIAHIVYHPNVFDQRLLLQIDSICSDSIPLYLTDITQSFPISHQKSYNLDSILQMIFLNPANLADEIEQFGSANFALYRIFLFSSTTTMNQNILFEIHKRGIDTRTLITLYNESSVIVFIENSSQSNGNVNEQGTIFILNHKTNLENLNLYDKTFGVYERMESIDIYRIDFYDSPHKFRPSFYLYDAFINYCHFHLNGSFINTIWHNRYQPLFPPIYHRTVIENHRNYYLEASQDYKLIEDETL